MSNYTDSEKEMYREMDEEYAIKYLNYNKLVEEYCNYKALQRETEFYKEDRIRFRANIFFSFVSTYMASCFCLNMSTFHLKLKTFSFNVYSFIYVSFIKQLIKISFL